MGNSQKSKVNEIESDYFPKGGYEVTGTKMEPIARVLLMGVYDDENPLSTFRGMRYIIQNIWQMAIQFNKLHYLPYIKVGNNPLFSNDHNSWLYDQTHQPWNKDLPCAVTEVRYQRGCEILFNWNSLTFPAPLKREININMMPIKMNSDTISKQLPLDLQGYEPWILACLKADPSQRDKICFLTIHESFVKKGRTQRRPGLHIEMPGKSIGGEGGNRIFAWGDGYRQKDGIYMASNMDDTCAVWNVKIVDRNDKDQSDIIGEMGNMEHIRSILPGDQRHMLKSNKLYWLTDRTPHEALPMERDGWRQFFRLVSHKLSAWYPAHSTRNPTGVKPNKKITKIIKGNKFG